MCGKGSQTRSDFGCPGAMRVGAPTRRDLLRAASCGFGMLALRGLMADRAYAMALSPVPHLPPRAKHVIFCFMDGGVSHVDSFDPKPTLTRRQGEPITKEHLNLKSQSQSTDGRVWFGSPWAFRQRGKSGLWVSDLFPHIASVADDLCVIRSMVGELPLHGQQNLLLHTGRVTGSAPSFGSWVSYGLGAAVQSLPGYVLLNNDWIPNGGFENFASAFLPATHAATTLRARGVPLDNVTPADPAAIQRRKLDLLREQDAEFAKTVAERDVVESAVRNYETAFAMQASVPALADVSGEPEAVRRLYGLDSPNEFQRYYGVQCLRARRLVESGVRFVEITCPLTHANNSPWDQHGQLKKYHGENALVTDQAVAALIADLKARGLLDETIVLWAGEMGRTPHTQKIQENAGRDHHVAGYSIFLAGGGFKGGMTYGNTDEFGNVVVENPLSIHDVHATILNQLGLDHEQLTYRFGGRDVSLTDVHGRVVTELLA